MARFLCMISLRERKLPSISMSLRYVDRSLTRLALTTDRSFSPSRIYCHFSASAIAFSVSLFSSNRLPNALAFLLTLFTFYLCLLYGLMTRGSNRSLALIRSWTCLTTAGVMPTFAQRCRQRKACVLVRSEAMKRIAGSMRPVFSRLIVCK